MPELTDPRQLFAHKLSVVQTSEREILNTLRKLQKETTDQELAGLFEHHAQETEQQIKNVEQVFEALGEQPHDVKARVVEGLELELEDFKKMHDPSPELVDAFLTGAATATEHHEISAYEGLITMAEAMGEQDIVASLRENLEQEQNMLMQVQQAEQKLAMQLAQQIPA